MVVVRFVDRIHDRDIPRLWAEHYPKSKTSGASKTLCMTMALILEDKAKAFTTGDDDPIEKLYLILKLFDIPKSSSTRLKKKLATFE